MTVKIESGRRRKVADYADRVKDDVTMESLIPGLPYDMALQCLAKVPLAALRGVCKTWQDMVDNSEDFHRVRAGFGLDDANWLYTLVHLDDGRCRWHAFDPLNMTWCAIPEMPDDTDFQLTSQGSIGVCHSVQCASTKKKLIMIAGLKRPESDEGQSWSQLEPALKQPWVFDPRKGTWRKGKPFSTPRKWCVTGVADEKVYVISGSGQHWNMSLAKKTEVYDPEADAWDSLPNLESSKFSGEAIAAVTVDGNLHMVSGKGVLFKEGAVYSPATRKWSKMPLGMRKGWTGSCVSVNNRFYALDDLAGKLHTYDADADSWKLVMEDPLLKHLTDLISMNGKIFAIVNKIVPGNGRVQSHSVRIIDVASESPRIFSESVPEGRLVSLQILARLRCRR